MQARSQDVECSSQHLLQRLCIAAAENTLSFSVRGDAAFQGCNPRSHLLKLFSMLRHGMQIREYRSRHVDFDQARESRAEADCAL